MSARVCQLCGKPLSRIRVGTEGDFCSREHRNQYRLRQGMDRLMEANKVANLMRRREMPKNIVPRFLESASSLERRAFAPSFTAPARPVEVKTMQPGGAAPGLQRSRRPQIALARFHSLPTAASRQTMTAARMRSQALFLLPKPRRAGGRASDLPAAPSREIAAPARRGDLLRVSGTSGFRLPEMQMRHAAAPQTTHSLRTGFRASDTRPPAPPPPPRAAIEQWSGLRGDLYIGTPQFAFGRSWGDAKRDFKDIPGLAAAAGPLPPGTQLARVAQVRIDLQESIHYAMSSEEDRA